MPRTPAARWPVVEGIAGDAAHIDPVYQWATDDARQSGRIRDVTSGPDGTLWMLTNNPDGRGDPRDGDDRILQVTLAPIA